MAGARRQAGAGPARDALTDDDDGGAEAHPERPPCCPDQPVHRRLAHDARRGQSCLVVVMTFFGSTRPRAAHLSSSECRTNEGFPSFLTPGRFCQGGSGHAPRQLLATRVGRPTRALPDTAATGTGDRRRRTWRGAGDASGPCPTALTVAGVASIQACWRPRSMSGGARGALEAGASGWGALPGSVVYATARLRRPGRAFAADVGREDVLRARVDVGRRERRSTIGTARSSPTGGARCTTAASAKSMIHPLRRSRRGPAGSASRPTRPAYRRPAIHAQPRSRCGPSVRSGT